MVEAMTMTTGYVQHPQRIAGPAPQIAQPAQQAPVSTRRIDTITIALAGGAVLSLGFSGLAALVIAVIL